jgi:hypothetical protein
VPEANPYQPPQAEVRDFIEPGLDQQRLELIASGQRLIIGAIGIYLGTGLVVGFLVGVMPPAVAGSLQLVGSLAGLGASLVGLARIGRGMGAGRLARTFMVICMLLPGINLILLLVVSVRATRILRKAGYRVGLLGARP